MLISAIHKATKLLIDFPRFKLVIDTMPLSINCKFSCNIAWCYFLIPFTIKEKYLNCSFKARPLEFALRVFYQTKELLTPQTKEMYNLLAL